ncbi:hypothetical protein V6N11_025524 [Hibiscus sabdariffa]|uniref:Uncharacterized protein n=1 Tax=Hibiscus sabdariffa TaxID=183260 RepID=A0ABR2NIU6_9ROSI
MQSEPYALPNCITSQKQNRDSTSSFELRHLELRSMKQQCKLCDQKLAYGYAKASRHQCNAIIAYRLSISGRHALHRSPSGDNLRVVGKHHYFDLIIVIEFCDATITERNSWHSAIEHVWCTPQRKAALQVCIIIILLMNE